METIPRLLKRLNPARFLKSPMGFLSATMFLNFAGLTIIIPVIPYIVERYTSNVALYVGLITSVAALCQFLATPALGYISDRVGRRPVLLWSLVGGVIGYIIFGIAGSLWMLFLGRIIDGLTGGDTTAMYAYVADITEDKERARYYGILGAVAAFGFMTGPLIGGLAARMSLTAPLFVAAGLSLLNAAWGYFVLPESLQEKDKVQTFKIKHLNPFTQFKHIFNFPALRILFAVIFIFFTGLILQQSNFSVFLKDMMHWGPTNIGILLAIVGLVDMLTEGFLIKWLLKFISQKRIAAWSTIITALGMLLVAAVVFKTSVILLYAGVVVYTIGDGLFEPATTGLIADVTPSHMHGRVQGASQSTQSIARCIAPLLAGILYQRARYLPYLGAAILILFSLAIQFFFKPEVKQNFT